MTIVKIYDIPVGRIKDGISARVFHGIHHTTNVLRLSFAGKSFTRRFEPGKPVRRFQIEGMWDNFRLRKQNECQGHPGNTGPDFYELTDQEQWIIEQQQ